MYYLRAKCYGELRNGTVAEMDLSQAIRADKSFSLAYYDRGMLRAVYLNKFPEAIQDLTQYLSANLPDQEMRNRALFYRGFCYYLTQQNNAALQDYRHVLRQDTKNARVHYLIGKAQVEIDSVAGACQSFKQAFSLGYGAAVGDIKNYCSP
jgi:tetratricopeptide (TPR) repeat protein